MKRTHSISLYLYWLWTAAIVALLVLHLVHLRADFPNYSPWTDYAKYTDEGWYGKAAIEHYVRGSWYVRGDFNPSVALPVLPALEFVVFHFTGVSLVAARLLVLAIFFANLVLVYVIVRTQAPRWVALFAVTLLAANAFLYAFSRLAILEPPMMLFLLASWLLALRLPRLVGSRRIAALIGIGLLLCLMVLTKTTAIFLLPSTIFLLWHACGYKLRRTLLPALTVALSGIIPFGAYYLVCVRPRYLDDYHYLFAANAWDSPGTLSGWLAAFWYALHGALWIDPWLCGLAVTLLALSVLFFRPLWRNPVIVASLLAAAGYIFFTGWHDSMQPRYYQAVAYPLIFFIALATHVVFAVAHDPKYGSRAEKLIRPLGFAALAVATISTAANLRQVFRWTRHPEYTWITAASQLTHYIDTHPYGNRLLLSISGDSITLITHLPAICDDFGTWDLPFRIHAYQPGWYAAWNDLDPGTLEDLNSLYSLEPAATFRAFDDPDRNQLVLYRLHPLPVATRPYNQALEAQANAGK